MSIAVQSSAVHKKSVLCVPDEKNPWWPRQRLAYGARLGANRPAMTRGLLKTCSINIPPMLDFAGWISVCDAFEEGGVVHYSLSTDLQINNRT